MKHLLLVTILLVCSNCLHKARIGPEYPQLQQMSEVQTGTMIHADSAEYQNKETKDTIEQMLEGGITRNDAIKIALLNNKTLQAKLEDLGLARSDLVQASLFSNPIFFGDALFPYKQVNGVSPCNNRNFKPFDFELFGYYNFADLWNVLLKKNVARDALQITIWNILGQIFTTIQQTRRAYDALLYAKILMEISQKNIEQITDTRKIIEKRSKSVVLATDFASVRLGRWKASLILYRRKFAAADVRLKQMLGLISPPPEPLKLTTAITAEWIEKIPDVITLQKLALRYRPELQQARITVKKFEDVIRLEKGKIFENIQGGFAVDLFSDGSKSAGPSLFFTFPAFNQNQGYISGAYYLHTQAIKRVIDLEIAVKAEVFEIYTALIQNIEQIDVYKSFIPQNEHLLETAQKKLSSVFNPGDIDIQMGAVVSGAAFYEIRVEYMDLYYGALNALSDLERAVGRRLDIDLPIDPDLISEEPRVPGSLGQEISSILESELARKASTEKTEKDTKKESQSNLL